ncbi:MAG: HEPN domain-containing protein, partial [Gemmataceae bacterium]
VGSQTLMDETGFLELADELSMGSREADWRTAISRAYYAAFHKARALLLRGGFRVPHAGRAHAYLWLRLNNSGRTDVNRAGDQLNVLRRLRNRADYAFGRRLDQAVAISHVGIALDIVQLLHQLANEPAILTGVIDAIKIYERDVLREVTWHP